MTDSVRLFVDDPTIADEEPLWRRIPPWHFVFDENLGRIRPSKAAFEDHPDGSPMSRWQSPASLSREELPRRGVKSRGPFLPELTTGGRVVKMNPGDASEPRT